MAKNEWNSEVPFTLDDGQVVTVERDHSHFEGVRLNTEKIGSEGKFKREFTPGAKLQMLPGTGYYTREGDHSKAVPMPLKSASCSSVGAKAFSVLLAGVATYFACTSGGFWLWSLAVLMILSALGTLNKKATMKESAQLDRLRKLSKRDDGRMETVIARTFVKGYDMGLNMRTIDALARKLRIASDERFSKYEEELRKKSTEYVSELFSSVADVSKARLATYPHLCAAAEELLGLETWYAQLRRHSLNYSKWSDYKSIRQEARAFVGAFNFIRNPYDTPVLQCADFRLYFYPCFIVKAMSSAQFEVINYDDVTVSTVAVEDYQRVVITIAKTMHGFLFAAKEPAEKFARMLSLLCENKVVEGAEDVSSKVSAPVKTTSGTRVKDSEGIRKVMAAASELVAHIESMSADNDLVSRINAGSGMDVIDRVKTPRLNKRLTLLAMMDLVNCFAKIGHPAEGDDDESLCLMKTLLLLSVEKPEADTVEALRAAAKKSIAEVRSIKTNTPDGKLAFVSFFRKYDEKAVKQYVLLLRKLISEVAVLDDNMSNEEKLMLNAMDEMGKDNGSSNVQRERQQEQQNEEKKEGAQEPAQETDPLADLEEMIGLGPVKEEVKKLASYVKVQKQREALGLKSQSVSYHCVFTGNPGTGKTTVARIVARIYASLGVLKRGHLVETDRSGLVAEYVGQTAKKTNDVIDSALDGVLFIDEAYALANGGNNDYGGEAISTLLKRMEDDRERLVVIIAGYNDEIDGFLETNPGLKSRFNRYINFPDYSADELLKIFMLRTSKSDYKLSDEARERVVELINYSVAHKDKNFGNGRFVRNLFEKIVQNQAVRVSEQADVTIDALMTIESEDVRM
ncbi:MAG: AAA family ATPase [Bacteroidales bacterium]|nr:AAA family ATPase [Bacteroidales bacterium]